MFGSSTQAGLWQPFAMVALVGEIRPEVVISFLALLDIPGSCAPGPPDLLNYWPPDGLSGLLSALSNPLMSIVDFP